MGSDSKDADFIADKPRHRSNSFTRPPPRCEHTPPSASLQHALRRHFFTRPGAVGGPWVAQRVDALRLVGGSILGVTPEPCHTSRVSRATQLQKVRLPVRSDGSFRFAVVSD